MDLLESLQTPLPNVFTVEMGKRIRQAREDRGLSQMELSDVTGRRQAAISAMENGKMEPDASTLVLLANVLQKPISYFIPEPWSGAISHRGVTSEEQELLAEFSRIVSRKYRRGAIKQLKCFADWLIE